MPAIVIDHARQAEMADGVTPPAERKVMPWYAVHTRSRHEDRACLGLLQKSFHAFLPKMEVWSKRKDRRKKIMIPMFPGYLFVELARWTMRSS